MPLPLVVRGIPVIPIDFTEPPVTVAMRALSLVGSPLLILACLLLALAFAWWRRWEEFTLLALTVSGGELINLLLKWLFANPRPTWPNPLTVLTSSSFPSGHAMRSVLCFGLLSYLLVPEIDSWQKRVWIVAAVGGLVLLIGHSRLYLEAHTLSEVLGGYVIGGSWLACTIIGVDMMRRDRRNHADISAAVNSAP